MSQTGDRAGTGLSAPASSASLTHTFSEAPQPTYPRGLQLPSRPPQQASLRLHFLKTCSALGAAQGGSLDSLARPSLYREGSCGEGDAARLKSNCKSHGSRAGLGPEPRACKGRSLSLGALEAGSQGHSEGGARGTFIPKEPPSLHISASCRERAQSPPTLAKVRVSTCPNGSGWHRLLGGAGQGHREVRGAQST